MATEITNEDGTLDADAATDAIDRELDTQEPESGEQSRKDTSDSAEDGGDGTDDEPTKLLGDEETARKSEDKPGEGEAEEESDEDEWFRKDDIRELVESLELSEEDIREFSGPDELDRHVRFLDKQLLEEGKRTLRPGDEQEEALAAQEEAERKQQASERAKERPRDRGRFIKPNDEEGDYKPSLDANDYDEELVGEFATVGKLADSANKRVQQLEDRILAFEAERMQAGHQQMVQSFDAIVDGLEHDDLFGSASELRPGSDQFKAREALWDTTGDLLAGMKARGKPAAMTATAVKRAMHQRFAKELSTKQRTQFSEKIRKQAKTRLGGGSQKSNLEKPYTGPIEKDPELIAAHKRMLEENG